MEDARRSFESVGCNPRLRGLWRVPIAVHAPLGLLAVGYLLQRLVADLEGLVTPESVGLWPAIGYGVIILAHVAVPAAVLAHRRPGPEIRIARRTCLYLCVVSSCALVVQKVMYDEVAREIYMEWPVPGETLFIVLGLGVNALFLLSTLWLAFEGRKDVSEGAHFS